jgi:hypothetical protein
MKVFVLVLSLSLLGSLPASLPARSDSSLPSTRALSDDSVNLLSALSAQDATGKPVLDQFQELLKNANVISSGTVSTDAQGIPTFTITARKCFGEECFVGGTLKLIGDPADTPAGASLVYQTQLSLYH